MGQSTSVGRALMERSAAANCVGAFVVHGSTRTLDPTIHSPCPQASRIGTTRARGDDVALSKDEILAAIKREAAANGGAPLGKKRFEVVTGIGDSAWQGRYWARWSDAVREAGFQPNEWQGAIGTDEDLVRHLATLAKELGRYPVSAERTLFKLKHPEFPDAKVFSNRLGNRDAQLALLLDFSLANEDFSEVYDMVRPLMKSTDAQATPQQIALGVTGSVYLMRSGKHYKIGFSAHVGRRSYEVALQLPEKLEVVHEIETDDPEGIERYWHQRFASKRTNGEWFALTDADVAAFKRRKSFM
jgi:Meiotically up-regulated gene 113